MVRPSLHDAGQGKITSLTISTHLEDPIGARAERNSSAVLHQRHISNTPNKQLLPD